MNNNIPPPDFIVIFSTEKPTKISQTDYYYQDSSPVFFDIEGNENPFWSMIYNGQKAGRDDHFLEIPIPKYMFITSERRFIGRVVDVQKIQDRTVSFILQQHNYKSMISTLTFL